MNLLEQIEKEHIAKLTQGRDIPMFKAGDTVQVSVKIIEGNKERQQSFEGVVIARKNRSIGSSFKVRKVTSGSGVERLFHLYSPNIKIKVVKRGRVRRAKLYYLRGRTGKAARIEAE